MLGKCCTTDNIPSPWFSETASCYVNQAALKFQSSCLCPFVCWDYRYAPTHQSGFLFLFFPFFFLLY
jgi:hypothetical protein